MKLQIVPARRGIQWVKSGIRTFFRQPLALAGLFFMFLALMSVLSLVPVIGSALALTLLPGATLGLMAATREAADGKFPMPLILVTAFRAGRQQMRAMLTLSCARSPNVTEPMKPLSLYLMWAYTMSRWRLLTGISTGSHTVPPE